MGRTHASNFSLLDAWAKKHLNKDFDKDGEFGRSGTVDEQLLQQFLADEFFAKAPPKSTGKEYFNLDWINSHIEQQRPEDIQATLTELTATLIANTTTNKAYICGGGIRNAYLMERIRSLSKNSIHSTEELGVDPDWVEAMCFAWLAKKRIKLEKIDLRGITGSSHPVLLGVEIRR